MTDSGKSNSPAMTRTGGGSHGGSTNSVISNSSIKKSAPMNSGTAFVEEEGDGNEPIDGSSAVHILLPIGNDDESSRSSGGNSGDPGGGDGDDRVEITGDRSGPLLPNTGSTNAVATSTQDDEGEENCGVGIVVSDSTEVREGNSRLENDNFLNSSSYPKEYGKTVLALLLVLLAAFFNGFIIAYIHQMGSDRQPLRDVVFEIVPYQRWAWTVADIMVTVCGTSCLLVAFFHKHNSIVVRRTALLATVLYVLRALFLVCTYLPPPFPDADERCAPMWNISSDPLQFFARASGLVFTVGFTGNSRQILCGDTIYSGHTMIYVLSGMVVCNYCPKPWRPLVPALIVVAVVFGITAVLISRQHYTIDVVVAVFVTVSVFYGFHGWCRQRRDRFAWKGTLRSMRTTPGACCSVEGRKNGGKRGIRFRPIYLIFLYFERQVPHGNLPRELAWPLPWPVTMVMIFENWNAYGIRVIRVLSGRPASSPLTPQRKLKKRGEQRKSSLSGASAYGDSRHALTSSSNSGLLNMQNGHQQQQTQQMA